MDRRTSQKLRNNRSGFHGTGVAGMPAAAVRANADQRRRELHPPLSSKDGGEGRAAFAGLWRPRLLRDRVNEEAGENVTASDALRIALSSRGVSVGRVVQHAQRRSIFSSCRAGRRPWPPDSGSFVNRVTGGRAGRATTGSRLQKGCAHDPEHTVAQVPASFSPLALVLLLRPPDPLRERPGSATYFPLHAEQVRVDAVIARIQFFRSEDRQDAKHIGAPFVAGACHKAVHFPAIRQGTSLTRAKLLRRTMGKEAAGHRSQIRRLSEERFKAPFRSGTAPDFNSRSPQWDSLDLTFANTSTRNFGAVQQLWTRRLPACPAGAGDWLGKACFSRHSPAPVTQGHGGRRHNANCWGLSRRA